MKRLVFCFDGTWNKIDAPHPTNVVIVAESVLPYTPNKISQLIYYDEGVGTARLEKYLGGIFGIGLLKNIAEAYRFLIFNYQPGDEIYVFGFSRGAFTARSFCGLLANCGVPLRKFAGRVNEAIARYKGRTDTKECAEDLRSFRLEVSPEVCINNDELEWRKNKGHLTNTLLGVCYLGVWDTVGALGIPASFERLNWANKRYRFHDTKLSSFVRSARHAVAIDERRKDYAPTLWTNIDELNNQAQFKGDLGDAPYQQIWFPGTHSSVGGGGERRGLSDRALDWVLDGARQAGLVLDISQHSRIFELKPDDSEYIENSAQNGFLYAAMNILSSADRLPGPASTAEVSRSAKRRWHLPDEMMADKKPYRPRTLRSVAAAIEVLDTSSLGVDTSPETKTDCVLYQVKAGDQLREIARTRLGSAERYIEIFRLNADKLESPDRIYVGQVIRIPKTP